ncbi:hypothetical protein HRG_012682 [Hirsutella rhossiliensis]
MPREHPVTVSPEETRAAAGRSIAETTQRRGDTSHHPHAANALLQKTHADAGLSITESIQGGTTASPFIAHTDGALPTRPGPTQETVNSSETLSSLRYITMTPVSALKSRHRQQDPGATKFHVPFR